MRLHEIVSYLRNGYDEETGQIEGVTHDAETGEVFEPGEIEATLEDKISACHDVASAYKAQAKHAKAEAARMTARAKAYEKRAERLGDYVFECLSSAGIKKVETATITAFVRKGSERVDIIAEDLIPEAWIKVTTSIDKASIKKELKSGRFVPGAVIVRGPSSLGWR